MNFKFEKTFEFIQNSDDIIYDCQFYPEKDRLAISTICGHIKIINVKYNNTSSKADYTFKNHHAGHSIRKIRFKNNLMFSAAKSIKITDLNKQTVIQKISNGKTKIYALQIIDENLISFGDDDGYFKIWDCRTNELSMSRKECEGTITDLDYDPENNVSMATSYDGLLTSFNIRSGKRMDQSDRYDMIFQSVCLMDERSKVIVGSNDGYINIFNQSDLFLITDRYLNNNEYKNSTIECIKSLDDKNSFVLGTSDGHIDAISLFPHRHVFTLTKLDEPVLSMDLNPVTKQVIATSENKLHLFSLESSHSKKRQKTGFFSDLEQMDKND